MLKEISATIQINPKLRKRMAVRRAGDGRRGYRTVPRRCYPAGHQPGQCEGDKSIGTIAVSSSNCSWRGKCGDAASCGRVEGERTSPRILLSHSCVKQIEATKLSSGPGLQVGEGVVLRSCRAGSTSGVLSGALCVWESATAMIT